jgi:hypothetical protein
VWWSSINPITKFLKNLGTKLSSKFYSLPLKQLRGHLKELFLIILFNFNIIIIIIIIITIIIIIIIVIIDKTKRIRMLPWSKNILNFFHPSLSLFQMMPDWYIPNCFNPDTTAGLSIKFVLVIIWFIRSGL